MKMIKSILNSMLVKLKHSKFKPYFGLIEQQLANAFQSKHGIWGMLGIYIGLGSISLGWVFTTIYHHFHYRDELLFIETKPAMPNVLNTDHLFAEPLKKTGGGFNITYQLEAILFDDDVKQREVVLKMPSGQTKTFQIGDELPDGVKILDIQAFQVKLEKNGQHKVLQLHQYQSDFVSDKPKSGQSLF